MTRDVCKALARKAFGAGSSVGARRKPTTSWLVEVWNPEERVVMSEDRNSLRDAYEAIAVRLRARIDQAKADALTDKQVHELYSRGAISLDEATQAVSISAARSRYETIEEFHARVQKRRETRSRCADLLEEMGTI